MKMKNLTTEIQTTYQTMVDTVEEFVVNEGKTIQQAIHAAEEKIDKAGEISKEEIQHVSNDLKDNLRILGETVEGASEAYKEQIKLNMAFVNDTILQKLMKIADSNTTQLIDFTRTLKVKAQAVTTGEHLTAHQEHNQWRSEHALWLSEVDFWKQEHEQVLEKLKSIEKTLEQQSAALDEHAQAIQALEARNHEHEATMANLEKDPSSEVFEVADEEKAAMHQQERQIHTQHAERHQTLKVSHYKTMITINTLLKKLSIG